MSEAPLRRADWRFLLPRPPGGSFRHLVLLGGPPGLAKSLAAEGVAERTSDRLATGADAVIALRDSGAEVKALAACLAPGGVIYREVDRRRPRHLTLTPARLGRTISAAGLTPLWSHWAIPGFGNTRRYLPLDRPEAIDWYFSTLHPAGSRLGWLSAAGASLLRGGDPHRLGALAPCFSVTARAGAAPFQPVSVLALPELPDRLREPGTGVVMLTSGQDDGSRVVLLPFPPGSGEPAAVVKVSRTERFNAHTEREQATLATLRAGLEPELRRSIPEPGGTACYGRSLVALEGYAPGAAMVHSTGRRGDPLARSIEDLNAAAEWLARFHLQSIVGDPTWSASAAGDVSGRLAEYRSHLATTAAETRLLDRAAGVAQELIGARLPTVWVHNDFGPWNIHRAGARITVIDWELSKEDAGARRGPALADLIYFATEWHLRARHLRGRAAELRGFRDLFIEPCGKAAEAARLALHDYMRRLDIDPRFLPLLLVTTWVDRARAWVDRQATAGSAGAAYGTNRYARYVTILAGAADRLFAGARA